MKSTYFTVGPSQIYPTVPEYARQALESDIFSLNHRGAQFQDIYASISRKLKELLSIPEEYAVFFLSSGTEAMERIIENTVEKNSFHIVTGTFGDRFFQTAKEVGRNASQYVVDIEKGFDEHCISVPKDAELIAVTQNDTSTGMQIPMEAVYKIGEQNPNALIAVDTVSSMPYVDIDYSRVDAVFFSVQKGFGMPAGLGVLILSPRAMKKADELHQKGVTLGSYHNFLNLKKYAQKQQTPDTPNVFAIYLLDCVLGDFLQDGIQAIREQTEEKAKLLYDFFAATETFKPLVKDKVYQSQTTLVISVEGGSEQLQKDLKAKGIIVGSGYGEHKNDHIRIANFPAHSRENVELLIEAIQTYQ